MALSKIDTTNMIEDVPQSKLDNNINFRNIIINGDMSIAQRGTSATGLGNGDSGYHTCDRWNFQENGSPTGVFTQSQSTDVPSGQGFGYSLKMDCTTADASLAASTNFRIQHRIEGQNLQYLKKGTSFAESLTLSFWVKSNKTGIYIAELYDIDNARQISKSYTISSASTWEKKTITYGGDTTGVLDNNNEQSLQLNLWLASGTDNSSGTLSTTWTSNTAANRAVGQVNLADSTSNEWYITGVQLEAGEVASDFEFLPYDVNLQRCLRYFCKFDFPTTSAFFSSHKQTTNTVRTVVETPVPMRTTPTINGTGQPTIGYQAANGTSVTVSSGTSLTVIGGIDLNRFIVSNPSVTGIGEMVNAFAYSGDLECSAEL